jgi:hypothetical protein
MDVCELVTITNDCLSMQRLIFCMFGLIYPEETNETPLYNIIRLQTFRYCVQVEQSISLQTNEISLMRLHVQFLAGKRVDRNEWR